MKSSITHNSALRVGLPGQPSQRLPPDRLALQGANFSKMAGRAAGGEIPKPPAAHTAQNLTKRGPVVADTSKN